MIRLGYAAGQTGLSTATVKEGKTKSERDQLAGDKLRREGVVTFLTSQNEPGAPHENAQGYRGTGSQEH